MSVGPIQEPSLALGAPPRDFTPRRTRVVEPCVRSGAGVDRFDRRRGLEPFDAPPGAVPYHRYIEAQNRIDRLERASSATGRAPTSAPPERRPDAARLGDVLPTSEQPAPPPPNERRPRLVHEFREAMTGRLIDVVY